MGSARLPGEDQLRPLSLPLCDPENLGRPASSLGSLGDARRPPDRDRSFSASWPPAFRGSSSSSRSSGSRSDSSTTAVAGGAGSKFDREGIHAALQVAELWTFNGINLMISRLGKDGKYHAVEKSGYLPLCAHEISRWIIEEDQSDYEAWTQRIRTGPSERSSAKEVAGLSDEANRLVFETISLTIELGKAMAAFAGSDDYGVPGTAHPARLTCLFTRLARTLDQTRLDSGHGLCDDLSGRERSS